MTELKQPEGHDWPVAGEFERMLSGLATLEETSNDSQAARVTVDPRDKVPQDPLYAEILDKATGQVRKLTYIERSNRFAGGEAHLFAEDVPDPNGSQETTTAFHLAVILREGREYFAGLHFALIPEAQATAALNRPVQFLISRTVSTGN